MINQTERCDAGKTISQKLWHGFHESQQGPASLLNAVPDKSITGINLGVNTERVVTTDLQQPGNTRSTLCVPKQHFICAQRQGQPGL